MMRKAGSLVLLLLTAALIVACGGSDNTIVSPPRDVPGGGDEEVPPAILAAVTIRASSNQLTPTLPVTITARVVDENNIAIEGIPVQFSADSGVLTITQGSTDVGGRATATLSTEEDASNRIITVTAAATGIDGNTLSSSVTVAVEGTELEPIQEPSSVVIGTTARFTYVLRDGNGNGIPNIPIDATSSLGNAINFDGQRLVTDVTGGVTFTLDAQISGTDTVSVSGLGLTRSADVLISGDEFEFTAPATNAQVPINTDRTATVQWRVGGQPVVGQPVEFSITRGTASPISVLTDGQGRASTTIRSSSAGPAIIRAETPDGLAADRDVLFIATNPASIVVQADPFTIAPNEQSTITATVRDPEGNLVTNANVVFELNDISGGSLSVGSDDTNVSGEAVTFYRASQATSARGGVIVTARVAGTTLSSSVGLTVARRELFFTFGTGNEIEESNPATYSLPFVVQATDADGNGVAGVNVQLTILTARYIKGYWVGDTILQRWFTVTNVVCADEDVNRNGQLDPGEDIDGDGVIDVGNNALITPGVATTDETGQILVAVQYAQQYGSWLQVEIEARTEVEGTSFSERQTFVLPNSATDVSNINVAPPGGSQPSDPANGYPSLPLQGGQILGPASPFGYGLGCDINL